MENTTIQFITSFISGGLAVFAGIVTANYTGKAEKNNLRQESRPYLAVSSRDGQLTVKNVSNNSCYDVKCEVEIVNKFFKTPESEELTLFKNDLLECKKNIQISLFEQVINKNKLHINKLINKYFNELPNKKGETLTEVLSKKIALSNSNGKLTQEKISNTINYCKAYGSLKDMIKNEIGKFSEIIDFYEVTKVNISLLSEQFEELTYEFIPLESDTQNNTRFNWENRKEIFNKK